MTSVREMLTHLEADRDPEKAIASSPPVDVTSSWQKELADAIRTPRELLQRLQLPESLLSDLTTGADLFPLVVPESFLRRMEVGNLDDPLLRQVLPTSEEGHLIPEFTLDPVGDQQAKQNPGILQKYHGRVLLMVTGSCAVNCRYCFRRHYPYSEEPRSLTEWQPAIESISEDSTIHEVILSGGDPLILGDSKLVQLITQLEAIPHLKRLRIHSRLPIVLPSRITDALINMLKDSRLQPVMVVHANHGNELQGDCEIALRKLVASGIPTLNQAVLLKGVNDSVEVLVELCERCINLGVIPYYLHQLDRVQGAAHFEVSANEGQRLIQELRQRLPGYAVPKYVQEISGQLSKSPVN